MTGLPIPGFSQAKKFSEYEKHVPVHGLPENKMSSVMRKSVLGVSDQVLLETAIKQHQMVLLK